MKTNTFVAAASLVLVVTYFLVMRIEPEQKISMTQFVPETALFYTEQHNGLEALKKFNTSSLGQKLKEIKFEEVAKNIGLGQQVESFIYESKKLYRTLLEDEIVEELFNDTVGFALDTPKELSQTSVLKEILKQNSVLITKPRHNAELLEFAAESYSKFSRDVALSVSQYGNHHIKRFVVKGERLSIVSIDGIFISSFNERLLRKCIDTYDGDFPRLSSSTGFQDVSEELSGSDRFSYISLQGLRSYLFKAVENIEFQWKKLLVKELKTTEGFEGAAFASWSDKAVVHDKLVVSFNIEAVNSVVRNHLSIQADTSTLLDLTTPSPALYYWSNTVDLKHLLPYVTGQFQGSGITSSIDTSFKQHSGLSLADFFSTFADEVCLVVERGNPDSFIPVPVFAFFLEMTDPATVDAAIRRAITSSGIAVKQKILGPVTYIYWAEAPQDGLQPVVGFYKDTLVLSNSSQLLEKIFSKDRGNRSIVSATEALTINPGFEKKNNSVTYLNNVEVITMIQRLLYLSSTMVALEDRDLAEKVKIVLNDLAVPLLDGLKMYEKSSSRSYFTDNLVIIDSLTRKRTDTQ